ncbi:MAG: sialate O-acetylesterase [bacterium]
MKSLAGLFDHMVLQRNESNVSDARFSGVSKAASGTLVASVSRGGKKLKDLTGVALGRVRAGKFSAVLRGLPAGGPYTIALAVMDDGGAVRDRTTVRDVLVGDVWILAGQSNMQGVGDKFNGIKKHPEVRAFFMDDHWGVAAEPIHDLSAAVDPVHADLCGGAPGKPGRYCACPGLSFGQEMRKRFGVPQGVIACAHGGTSMAQWDPKLRTLGGKSLYGAMLRRFHRNGGKVAGMLWYQGCNETTLEAASVYTARMKEFVAACRHDFGFKEMPFVLVQISRFVGWGPEGLHPWNSVREQQRCLPRSIKRCLTVPAIDLPMDDLVHIGGEGQAILGRRLAEAMDVLIRGRRGGRPPITLKAVTIAPDRDRGTADVVVEFDHVAGRLIATGRPNGFILADVSGNTGHVYDVRLSGNKAIVRTTQGLAQVCQFFLYHGFGLNPYCNIGDEAGRSLPAFGPVVIGVPRALTPFIRTLRVSDFQPGAGKLDRLEYPANPAALNLGARSFGEDFCNMHTDIMARKGEDLVLYYACAFDCREAMKLSVLLGYDGPVRVWIDGRPVYHDPHGTNPAIADAHPIAYQATAGRHEVLVALGTNHDAAWGIFLRIERLGLSRAAVKAGPGTWGMPTVLG